MESGEHTIPKVYRESFLVGPVVKNLLCNAVDVDSIPGQGTKIPHASR